MSKSRGSPGPYGRIVEREEPSTVCYRIGKILHICNKLLGCIGSISLSHIVSYITMDIDVQFLFLV